MSTEPDPTTVACQPDESVSTFVNFLVRKPPTFTYVCVGSRDWFGHLIITATRIHAKERRNIYTFVTTTSIHCNVNMYNFLVRKPPTFTYVCVGSRDWFGHLIITATRIHAKERRNIYTFVTTTSIHCNVNMYTQ